VRNAAQDPEAHGYAIGVPLLGLVWDPESAMDRQLALDDVGDVDEVRYVAIDPVAADGR